MTRMQAIRLKYGVPAKRGMEVSYHRQRDGEEIKCLIVGTSCSDRLRVKMRQYDGKLNKRTSLMHPTWNLTYPKP